MKYLKEFIIGSCAFINVPWFISVNNSVTSGIANYSYYNFTMSSPVGRGLWNAGSAIVADYFGMTTELRFVLVTLFQWSATIISIYYYKLYTFIDDKERMLRYSAILLVAYFIHWYIIIYILEKYI